MHLLIKIVILESFSYQFYANMKIICQNSDVYTLYQLLLLHLCNKFQVLNSEFWTGNIHFINNIQ